MLVGAIGGIAPEVFGHGSHLPYGVGAYDRRTDGQMDRQCNAWTDTIQMNATITDIGWHMAIHWPHSHSLATWPFTGHTAIHSRPHGHSLA